MRLDRRSMLPAAALLALAGTVVVARQTPAPAGAPAASAQSAPAAPQPQIQLAPGLREVPDYRKLVAPPPAAKIPDGFTAIFNGRDLSGWHVSKTARHGVQPDFHVAHGMILGTQRPLGGGGLLITDKKYRNYELYMEVKPDWGNDSGIFLRTTESGAAYQITLDYLPGGSMGRLISEGGIQFGAGRGATPAAAVGAPASAGSVLSVASAPGAPAGGGGRPAAAATAAPSSTPAAPATPSSPAAATGQAAGGGRSQTPDAGMAAWKREDWNTVRVRVAGDVPHATVWINDQQISDATDTENHAVNGMIDGPIAIQIHGGAVRWQPGGFWRWRNLAIKELAAEAR